MASDHSPGLCTEVTGASSPTSGRGKSGKILAVRVQMLDDSVTLFQIQAKALGSVLFEQVCKQLNLLESDYFGLEYAGENNTRYWVDMEKPINRQMGLSLSDPLLRFGIKFYTPDPAQLEEEFTRYLFCMQIKQDLAIGVLQCNDKTAALIASYLVQAECGDYVAEDYPDHTYLSTYKFIPTQDAELERRIMENHKKHVGQSPAEADLNLLETARRCEMYGIKMHPAKDPEGVPLNLAVASVGVVVFQNFAKINTFSWAKVRKLSFKRKKFLIKLHPEAHGNYKDVIEFYFDGRDECKNFWKKCVEHHGFFRCSSVRTVPRPKPRVLSRGSSFRYTGRTQKEIVDFVRENYVKRQSFQRSQSFRHVSPLHTSGAGVGTSLSVHPLLPVNDQNVPGATTSSLSCGSVVVSGSDDRRSPLTPDRSETTIDVHHHHPQPLHPQRRELDPDVDSAVNCMPQQLYNYQSTPAGVFHSLPRTSASGLPSASAAGQIDSTIPLLNTTSAHESSQSSEYSDPTEIMRDNRSSEGLHTAEESRDSYDLLSDSDPMFCTPNDDDEFADERQVSYVLHRRHFDVSKSCEDLGVARGASDVKRSLSFRCSRDGIGQKLFARTSLHMDLNDLVCKQLVRPKSIDFVSFQDLPPPDAFSSRDDTVESDDPQFDLVMSHSALPSYPVRMELCELSQQETALSELSDSEASSDTSNEVHESEELTDAAQNAELIYQDTLSSTSLEEQVVSEDPLLDFVNDDDGLPDPLDDSDGFDDFPPHWPPSSVAHYGFPARVLSRISERDDSRMTQSEADNTMSDISTSLKADPLDDDQTILPACLPPPPLFDETTPVNEMPAPFPRSGSVEESDVDAYIDPPLDDEILDLNRVRYIDEDEEDDADFEQGFPSPPSSILDNIPVDKSFSSSTS